MSVLKVSARAWVGEWDISNNAPLDTPPVVRESFDVLGINFEDGDIYGFDFATPFALDGAKDYAFQTVPEPSSHLMLLVAGCALVARQRSSATHPFPEAPPRQAVLCNALPNEQ